jgi:hypothetical protein
VNNKVANLPEKGSEVEKQMEVLQDRVHWQVFVLLLLPF